jgi:N-acetylmuramoyl-L-alanine amidase
MTLAISLELAKMIDREPGLQALMIRDGDYYVGLRERMDIARKHRADLFVSIHADAFPDAKVHGSSVYTLSHGGASSAAAKWLANRENNADQIGGVEVAATDDLLASVLMDMTQNATIEHSTEAAALVLANLRRLGGVHRNYVQRAGFVVLQAPDIPSILVETAFISNPEEEKRLRDRGHQRRFAEAIVAGINAYFRKYPPPGMLVASTQRGAGGAREYVITPGDTLSDIAKRHQVSLSALRAHNGLTDDMIRVGQILAIPEDS